MAAESLNKGEGRSGDCCKKFEEWLEDSVALDRLTVSYESLRSLACGA